jgi:hypothetical protein
LRATSVARALLWIAFVGASAYLPSQATARQLDGVPRQQHPWGQFKIGSWKTVRAVTESLNARGEVIGTNVTETTSKLVDVDDTGYTLRIDVVVVVAGKRFNAQPQVIRRGYCGEGDGQNLAVKRVGRDEVIIGDHEIPCEVRQITVDAADGKRITTVHYSHDRAPHVLRRETTSLDPSGKPTNVQTQVDVVAVDMPYRVLRELKPTAQVRVMHQQGQATTLTLEMHCDEVPGAVVAHTSKETDETGAVIRRSTLELLDYGIGTGEDSDAQVVRRVFHRARNRRGRG